MISTILDLNLPLFRNAMLVELREIMDTTTTCGWDVGKALFAATMTKIEEGKLQWDDANALWQTRMNAKSDMSMVKNRNPSPPA